MDRPDDPLDRQADRFFEALSAAPGAEAASSVGARRLRDAVLARERVLSEAAKATVDELTADEQQQMENIRRSLVSLGTLPAASDGIVQENAKSLTGGSVASAQLGWLHRLRAWLAVWYAGPSWAVGAALVVCAGVVLQLLPPNLDDSNTLRGDHSTVMGVNDPEASSAALAEDMRAAGAHVFAAPLDERRWALHIEVTPATRAAVEAVARSRGLGLSGDGPFIVHVEPLR